MCIMVIWNQMLYNTLTLLNYACIGMLKIWVKSTVYHLLKMNYTNKKIKTKFYHFSNKHLPNTYNIYVILI